MKGKYIIMPMMLALLSVATSCEQEDMPPSVTDSDVVEIVATIGSPATRVSQPEDNQYVFDIGDKIHVVGWYGDKNIDREIALEDFKNPDAEGTYLWWNDAASTYNGSDWKTEPYMRWQNGEDLIHHFIAWWPEDVVKSNDNLAEVEIKVTGDYKKDDILYAEEERKRPNDSRIRLDFHHIMSRFDLYLKFGNEYTDVADISVHTHLPNTATFNFFEGDFKPERPRGEGGIAMTAHPFPKSDYDWSGTCIVVPQAFSKRSELLTITFTADGKQKAVTYEHNETMDFIGRHRTTLTLKVGKDKVDVEGVSVTDWNEEEVDGGVAEYIEKPKITGITLLELEGYDSWGTCKIDAENQQYIFTIPADNNYGNGYMSFEGVNLEYISNESTDYLYDLCSGSGYIINKNRTPKNFRYYDDEHIGTHQIRFSNDGGETWEYTGWSVVVQKGQ